MAIATSNGLVDVLRECRLLEPGLLQEIARDLQPRFKDPRTLARELMRRNWLTAYQVNQVFAGRAGDLLLGSYIILERLGEGGMGTVFKARHLMMGRVVALKLIRKDKLGNPEAIRRFEREIRAAAQLVHPNIVTAYDADQVGDRHFFVMEYVEGADLARLVRDTGPLPVEQACAYIRQAAQGLQHAHEKGMVHRDIKPSNLLLSMKEGQVKILDMGLARVSTQAASDDATPLTETGTLVGTPDYGAPEQARQSHQVDIRADLYGLGCSLYFLLTGRPPFPGGTVGEKLVKHQLDEPESVQKLNPEVPAAVAAILRRLLAKRPQDRFQTPTELVAALGELNFPKAGSRSAPQTMRMASSFLRTSAGPILQAGRRHLTLVAVVLLVAVLLIGGIAAVVSVRGPRTHPVLGYAMKQHPPDATELAGHWFAFFPEKLPSWDDARRRCREMGGYLACVKTPEAQQLLLRLSQGQPVWLGGQCSEPRKWFWVTGEPFATTYWGGGQPNSGPNSRLQLWNSVWHDIGPDEQNRYPAGFICEWDE